MSQDLGASLVQPHHQVQPFPASRPSALVLYQIAHLIFGLSASFFRWENPWGQVPGVCSWSPDHHYVPRSQHSAWRVVCYGKTFVEWMNNWTHITFCSPDRHSCLLKWELKTNVSWTSDGSGKSQKSEWVPLKWNERFLFLKAARGPHWSSQVVQMVKNLPAIWETWVWSQVGKIPWRREW